MMKAARKKMSKIAALVLTGTLVASLMVGCGKEIADSAGTSGANSTAQATKVEEPTQISILTQYYDKVAPDENNVILKEIEKNTNTKLKINWVPATNYNDKANLQLASGDLSDLTLILTPHADNVRILYSQGAFWDITNVYKDYKALAALTEQTWANVKAPDGNNYIVPRPRPIEGGGTVIAYRADLFEAAGIALPTTTEDLYKALVTLKKSYPDHTAFLASADTSSAGTISLELQLLSDSFNKTYNNWGIENGNVVFGDLKSTMKDSIAYIKKLYDEKLLNQDFVVLKDPKTAQNSGKWIATGLGSVSNTWDVQKEINKIDPKAKVRAIPAISGMAHKGSGSFGGYAISKKVPEDKMKKIMSLLDYLNDNLATGGGELCSYGIKDVHFTMENGVRKANKDAMSRDSVGAFGQIGIYFDKYVRAGTTIADIPADLLEYNKKIIDEQEKISTINPMDLGLVSPTGDKLFAEYYKKSADIKTKVILGLEPMSSWDKYVEELKADATLKKAMEELTQSYQSKGGK